MKKVYKGHANKSGIYKIVNTSNGRVYFGSCKRFKQRFREHYSRLLNGRHCNRFLQNDFSKCGETAFEIHVVEVVDGSEEQRRLVEQKYIDEVYDGQKTCYNIAKKTDSLPRRVFSNDPGITKKILSAKSKAMWKDPATRKKILKRKNEAMKTPEYKKALKEGLEKAWDDDERRQKTSKRLKKEHASGSREGAVKALKKHQPKGRKTFRERMSKDAELKKGYQERGKKKAAKLNKKYKKDSEYRKMMDEKSRKNIVAYNESRELTKKPDLVGPDGTVYKDIHNLAKFAREHGLDPSGAYKLIRGKLKKHRGFRLK